MQKLVALYRVSTDKQGRSGLGLEAQQSLVKGYQTQYGGEIVKELVEVESSGAEDRPVLSEALRLCRKHRAKLVLATLDRLTRDVHTGTGLLKSGIEIVCADAPNMSMFEMQIRLACAEEERRKIRERTRNALAAYKARGGVLGANRPNARPLSADARRKGAAVSQARAARFYGDVVAVVKARRAAGATLAEIANHLNASGRSTQSGLPFTPTSVHRLLARAAVA